MTETLSDGLLRVQAMTAGQREQVEALLETCRTHDGLELAFDLEDPSPSVAHISCRFLCVHEGNLVGFTSVDGGHEVEIYPVVHPSYRRHGIGSGFLNAARDEARHRGARSLLLVCEDRSSSGKAFAAAVRATFRYAEHGMELERGAVVSERDWEPLLEIAIAPEAEVALVASVTAAAFEDDQESFLRRYRREILEPHIRFFIARLRGEPIGTMRLMTSGDLVYITAFGILAPCRGHGFGQQFLARIITMLLTEGWPHIMIEVVTDNQSALSLYRRCGFRERVTYGHYYIRP